MINIKPGMKEQKQITLSSFLDTTGRLLSYRLVTLGASFVAAAGLIAYWCDWPIPPKTFGKKEIQISFNL